MHLLIVCQKQIHALWSIKIRINDTLFDAQNAENRISELFRVFLGEHTPRPPRGKGPYAPFVVTAAY